MKLLELTELLQALYHRNPISTKIPAKMKNKPHVYANLNLQNEHYSTGQQSVKLVYSQFGEHLQIREIVYMSDVVVLHIQMGKVGGKAEVANVCDLIVIQVKDSEVSAHGEVTLKIK